jgi:hypothetical protein
MYFMNFIYIKALTRDSDGATLYLGLLGFGSLTNADYTTQNTT